MIQAFFIFTLLVGAASLEAARGHKRTPSRTPLQDILKGLHEGGGEQIPRLNSSLNLYGDEEREETGAHDDEIIPRGSASIDLLAGNESPKTFYDVDDERLWPNEAKEAFDYNHNYLAMDTSPDPDTHLQSILEQIPNKKTITIDKPPESLLIQTKRLEYQFARPPVVDYTLGKYQHWYIIAVNNHPIVTRKDLDDALVFSQLVPRPLSITFHRDKPLLLWPGVPLFQHRPIENIPPERFEHRKIPIDEHMIHTRRGQPIPPPEEKHRFEVGTLVEVCNRVVGFELTNYKKSQLEGLQLTIRQLQREMKGARDEEKVKMMSQLQDEEQELNRSVKYNGKQGVITSFEVIDDAGSRRDLQEWQVNKFVKVRTVKGFVEVNFGSDTNPDLHAVPMTHLRPLNITQELASLKMISASLENPVEIRGLCLRVYEILDLCQRFGVRDIFDDANNLYNDCEARLVSACD